MAVVSWSETLPWCWGLVALGGPLCGQGGPCVVRGAPVCVRTYRLWDEMRSSRPAGDLSAALRAVFNRAVYPVCVGVCLWILRVCLCFHVSLCVFVVDVCVSRELELLRSSGVCFPFH